MIDKKVLYIFGLNGYIGYHLKKLLLCEDYKIVSINNTFFDRSYKKILKKFNQKDICINLSSVTANHCNDNRNKTLRINVDLNKEICDTNIGKIIFTSSASIYKNSQKLLNEDDPVHPTSLYTETKIIAENIIKSSNKYIIIRPGICFGGDRMFINCFVNEFIHNALENKKINVYDINTFRPYVPVITVAETINKLIKSKICNEIINVGFNNMNFKKIHLVTMINRIIKSKDLNFKFRKPTRSYKLDCTKLHNLLPLKKTNFNEQIINSIKSYKHAFKK
jgi:nucleoside-diphosphate-sugar epimerase